MRTGLRFIEKTPATILVLLAVVSINIGSALAILLFELYPVLSMLFLRMLLAAIMLGIAYHRQLLHALKQAPAGILLLGIVIAVQSGAFYEAIARIPLGVAVAIEFLGPLGLALASSRRWLDAVCVLLAAVGIVLLTPDIGTRLDPWGVALAVCSGAAWAGVILINRRLGKRLAGGVGIALGMSVCALLLFPVSGVAALQTLMAHPATVYMVIGVALFSAAIPYLFEYLALKNMPPRQFGVLVALEPVVAAIVGAIALAQLMDLRTWLAVILISAAAVVTSLLEKEPVTAQPEKRDPLQ